MGVQNLFSRWHYMLEGKRAQMKRPSRRQEKSQKASEFLIWILVPFVALVPLVIKGGLSDYSELPKSVYIQIGAVLLLLLWLVMSSLRKTFRIVRTPFDLPLLAFLAWSGLSLIWAHNGYEGGLLWIHWAACFLVYFVVTHTFKNASDVRRLAVGMVVAASTVALVGVLQSVYGMEWVLQEEPPAATFANKNLAAEYIILALPLIVALFLITKSRVGYWICGGAFVLTGFFLLRTLGKAAWLAAAIQAGFLAAVFFRDGLKAKVNFELRTKARVILATLGIVVIALYLSAPRLEWGFTRAYQAVTTVLYPVGATSLTLRWDVWLNTFEMIKDHPLLGVGLGNFKVFYPAYHRKVVVDELLSGERQWYRTHNDYLQVFAELGPVGILLLGWIAFSFFKVSLSFLKGSSTEKRTQYLFIAIVAAIIGISVDAIFSFPLQVAVPPLIVMVFLGILGGTYSQKSISGLRSEWKLPSWIPLYAGIAVAALLVVLIRWESRLIVADEYLNQMLAIQQHQDWAGSVVLGKKAYENNPYDRNISFYLARGYLESRQPDSALKFSKEVVQAYPYYINALHNLGTAYFRTGNLDEALNWFERVLEIKPDYAETHEAIYALGRALLEQKSFAKAQTAFETGIQYKPEDSLYHFHRGIAALNLERVSVAKEGFEKAVQLRPNWDEAHLRLGTILFYSLGEKEKGVQHLQKALELNPSAPYADPLREELIRYQQEN